MTRPYLVQAITTKYLGPTNTRGSRIKATAAAGSITVHRDCSLNIEQNHARAAQALCDKFGWRGRYFQGSSPNDSGYCFVCIGEAGAEEPAFVIEDPIKDPLAEVKAFIARKSDAYDPI